MPDALLLVNKVCYRLVNFVWINRCIRNSEHGTFDIIITVFIDY